MVKNRLVLSATLIVFAPLFLHGANNVYAGENVFGDGLNKSSMRRSGIRPYSPKNWTPLHKDGTPIKHSDLVDLVVTDDEDNFMPNARKILKESIYGPEILDAHRSAYEKGDFGHLRSLMTDGYADRSTVAPNPEFVKSIFSPIFIDKVLGATVSQSQHSSVVTIDPGLSLTPPQGSLSSTDSDWVRSETSLSLGDLLSGLEEMNVAIM